VLGREDAPASDEHRLASAIMRKSGGTVRRGSDAMGRIQYVGTRWSILQSVALELIDSCYHRELRHCAGAVLLSCGRYGFTSSHPSLTSGPGKAPSHFNFTSPREIAVVFMHLRSHISVPKTLTVILGPIRTAYIRQVPISKSYAVDPENQDENRSSRYRRKRPCCIQ
jgi:hypothetical protein